MLAFTVLTVLYVAGEGGVDGAFGRAGARVVRAECGSPETPNPKPQTLHPKPQTQTLNPKP